MSSWQPDAAADKVASIATEIVELIYLIAYILTGIVCVVWDFRKPFHDRPAYARRPGQHLSMIAIVIIAWLPIKLYATNRRRQWGEAIKAIITFAVLAVGGNLIA